MSPKTCYNRWNCVSNIYISWKVGNYIISAAILDFWLKVSSDSATDNTIERFDPEKMGIDTRIMFLSRQLAKLLGGATPPLFTLQIPVGSRTVKVAGVRFLLVLLTPQHYHACTGETIICLQGELSVFIYRDHYHRRSRLRDGNWFNDLCSKADTRRHSCFRVRRAVLERSNRMVVTCNDRQFELFRTAAWKSRQVYKQSTRRCINYSRGSLQTT